ncbi:hypothetical protein C8R41DRAFT_276313 [Lentinula lateritia]|uniref:Hemerythrin-like domain-containing protein n=1 Tax=Lentinula lateritia TaxID=40482 RepID=A0ABQ8VLR2_9AGAR|nr:hypothetical protein C8R41DRAFT_276313 [Lentinula lateritia]
MPAPYPLLDMPPGSIKNIHEYPAIHMAAVHNMFIQSINAIVAHAPTLPTNKLQPFMVFCFTVIDNIHHHHHIEETFLFPELEKKLGAGTLSRNFEEHADFVPQLDELKVYLQKVQTGELPYDGPLLVEKIHLFSDSMMLHLSHEIPTLEASRLKAVFTEKELKDIDSQGLSIALKTVSFYTSIPWGMVCANPATPWWVLRTDYMGLLIVFAADWACRFPPLPLPVKLATRWWFSRRYREAWEFGPLDLYGKPRQAEVEKP